MSGILYIVATPMGNLEDITFRAVRILREVSLIAAEDTRHTRKLLAHFDIHTPLTSFFQGNERTKSSSIIEKILSGQNVALVSDAGTPCISDPGYPLLKAAISAGIRVVPVPGASAILVAISVSGLPTDRFTFIGFLPDKPGKRRNALEGIKNIPHTLIFYVSPWKVIAVIGDCLEILGGRNACLCREITKLHEEFIRIPLSALLEHAQKQPLKGEMVLIVEGAKKHS